MFDPSIDSPESLDDNNFQTIKRPPLLHNPPSFVVKEKCKFLIMDAPTDYNLPFYIDWLKKLEIRTLVRTCEPTYTSEQLDKAGIKVIDIGFPDDELPSNQIINNWLHVVKYENMIHDRPLAVHCVAGLGRSALLAAIALMEFAEMGPLESVEYIRRIRRGAIDQRHLNFLKQYKMQRNDNCCIVL